MEQVARYLEAQADVPIVVRGWPAEAVTLLKQRGWQCWQVGQEGRLPLHKSLPFCRKTRHAIRRGQQVAVFQQLSSGLDTAKQMAVFQREALGRGVNQLQWLFRQPPDASLRLYVARSPSGQIWGALGTSTNRPGFVQAEWMVRYPRAPFGVLDALVAYVLEQERHAGHNWFLFGEVPFVNLHNPQLVPQWILRGSAVGLKPLYNYPGLFHFKNKYVTHWQPVYLCGFPVLTPLMVAGIGWRSNALQLWRRGVNQKVKLASHKVANLYFLSNVISFFLFLPI